MKVRLFGTRGSTPICHPRSHRYGGNTTSLRVESECIPEGWALAVDTGTGFVPLSEEVLDEGVMNIAVIYTHYHHDHTQGFLLAPHTHIPSAQLSVWGPEEHRSGPRDVLQGLMKSPDFPVDFARIAHRVRTHSLKHIGTQVLVIHPVAGFHQLDIHRYKEAVYSEKQLKLGNARYPVGECLVVFMYKTTHPEYSISYRFQEKPTGRSFVFLTDHENTAGLPNDLRQHVNKANLLVQDAQYSEEVYQARTGGFGHGTPEYCASVMHEADVERLGLTHHDPKASDEDVDQRVQEARAWALANGITDVDDRIFGCADFTTYDV